MKSKMKNTTILALSLALLPFGANAAIVVNDTFDDGDIGTNTLGIGTGFNAATKNGATLAESGGSVELDVGTFGGNRAYMTSKEGATIATSTRYEFIGVNFSLTSSGSATTVGATRYYFGVKGTNPAADMQGNPETGFWMQIGNSSFGAAVGVSRLFYEANDNTRTNLATWEFDTLDFANGAAGNYTPTFDFTLDLDATGYSLAITGDTISNLTGSFSDTYANAGIVNQLTTGYAASFMQGENPAVAISFDQIIITDAVPEPSSAVLIGLGGLALILRRRK